MRIYHYIYDQHAVLIEPDKHNLRIFDGVDFHDLSVRVREEHVFHPACEKVDEIVAATLMDWAKNSISGGPLYMVDQRADSKKSCTRLTLYRILGDRDFIVNGMRYEQIAMMRDDNTSTLDTNMMELGNTLRPWMDEYELLPKVNVNPVFPVIVLIGSTKFKDEYHEMAEKLYREGYIVLMTHWFSHADDIPMTSEQEDECWRKYRSMMQMATDVMVINPGGYIGTNTQKDLDYAMQLGLKIHYMDHNLSDR